MRPSAQRHRTAPLWIELLIGLILTAAVCGFFWWIISLMNTAEAWANVRKYEASLWKGWRTTLVVSLFALLGSTFTAILLVAGLGSPLSSLRWFCRGFIELVRGMPLLALVIIGYYVVFTQSSVSKWLQAHELGDKLTAGTILLSLFTGAYLCEILRGGLESIPQGQIDSGRAVGFTPWQLQRYVIFPQALRRVLPALAGQFVTLVKDSSLLSVIGISEFTYTARSVSSATYGGTEAYLALALGYLALTIPIASFAHWLEARFRYQM